jgi:hypothetical protein
MALVGATRTAWHFFFGLLLRKRGPRGLDVRDEVPLSDEPPRLDYLLLRKLRGPAGEDGAETLRRLWPMLPAVSVVEYKSPTHPYRSGHLDRLWGYVHIHFANQRALPRMRAGGVALAPGTGGAADVGVRDDLGAVLVVAARTPSLDGDAASMGLSWEDCGGGYWRVHGGLFALYVVEIDVAGPADGDDLLYSLGHGKPTTAAARRFWMELTGSKEAAMSMQDMEGYAELMQKFLDSLPPEQRLAGLAPEQRLAGLAPEQRLAGLDHDHQALALPLDVLRLLPEEYLQSLSPEVRAELRRRLGRNGH